jgi:hypothetical protein
MHLVGNAFKFVAKVVVVGAAGLALYAMVEAYTDERKVQRVEECVKMSTTEGFRMSTTEQIVCGLRLNGTF